MKQRFTSWIPLALGLMVVLMGLLQLSVAIFPSEARYLQQIEPWTPFHVHFGSRALLLLVGIGLVALGRGLARRKKAAWWLAVVLLGLGPWLHLGLDFNWQGAVGCLVPLVLLLAAHHHFRARSDAGSLRLAIGLTLGGVIALFAFGWVVLMNFGDELAGPPGDSARLQAIAELVLLQSTDTLVPTTSEAQTAFYAISFAGAGIALLVIFSALRPVLRPARPTVREIERARKIVQSHGGDPLVEFAIADDKRLFFSSDGSSLVSYALWRNFALTLADPIGPLEKRQQAVREFIRFCEEQDWEPVFYQIAEKTLENYHTEGFILFKIGECATIDLREFSLSGRKFQDLRTVRNRASREGLQVRWLRAGELLEPALAQQLREVSDIWLQRKKGQEMAFDIGAFSEVEIEDRGAVLAMREDGRVEAFATWLPYAGGQGRCLDLMRSRPEMPGVMDLVIVESLLGFQAQGVVEASLANAPLANVGPETGDKGHDKAVRYIYENFNRLYGYKTLFNFKSKYHPQWSGRYLAYRRLHDLPLIACAMVGIHSPGRGLWRLLHS